MTQHEHTLYPLMYELQTLNTKQKQAVHNITDRSAELENVLVLLQTMSENINILTLKRKKRKGSNWFTQSDKGNLKQKTLGLT